MNTPISKFKSKIKLLNPLTESAFKYEALRWKNLHLPTKEIIKDFENEFISRLHVIDAYKEYYKNGGSFIRPFALTMVWGFSSIGYGTFRTNKYVEIEANNNLIKLAIDEVKANNIEIAFKTLMQIKGLSISYVSKVLYFASRAAEKTLEYPLIFDIRVARALVELTTPKEIFELVSIYPSTSFKEYMQYNQLLHQWSKEIGVEADAVEMFLFEGRFYE